MPRTQATPEQKEEVRRVIRQAAADVYNSVGSSGVSVRAIAKEAARVLADDQVAPRGLDEVVAVA